MSIQHVDNFGFYGTDSSLMLNGVWGEVAGSIQPDPAPGTTNVVFKTDTTAHASTLPVEALNVTQGIAFRIWPTQLACDVQFGWLDDIGDDVVRLYFTFTASGRVQVYNQAQNGASQTLLGESAVPVIVANAWQHVEVKSVASLTGDGTIEVRVEGVTVLSLTGITTELAEFYNVGWNNNHSAPAYVKDLVTWDGAGSQNNDFLGTVLVAMLTLDADIALNWTPTPSGTPGFDILSNNPPLDTTAYLDAPNPPPDAYKATMTSLDTDVTSVRAVMTVVRAAKTDGGDASLQVGLISSPSSSPATTLGEDRPITVAPTYWQDVFEVDPKTSAEWLPHAVNIAQIQINRTT